MISRASGIAASVFVFAQILGASPALERAMAMEVENLRSEIVEQRRDFHRHPELSNREERTSAIVAAKLRALGFTDIRTKVARHGVVATLQGGKPGPLIAVRADMDALPIQEINNVPYKSQVAGVKHACGHDMHTAVQLAVASILYRHRQEVPGAVRFIFQPAEEGAPTGEKGGASLMIEEGALENPKPAAIFGLHSMPQAEVGNIIYHSGPAMASSDQFEIVIRGKMAHGGAFPHKGIDAVVVAAESLTALQTIRSRKIDTLEPMVVSVGTIHGGNRFNVLAEEVKMEGTVRALDEDVRHRIHQAMREILSGVTSAHGAKFELKFGDGNPVTYNNPQLVEEMLPVIRRVAGPNRVLTQKPLMGAEDFSYYGKSIPAFYYFVGVGNTNKGITAGWHTADFDIDEEALVVGTKVMSAVLMDYLERHSGDRR